MIIFTTSSLAWNLESFAAEAAPISRTVVNELLEQQRPLLVCSKAEFIFLRWRLHLKKGRCDRSVAFKGLDAGDTMVYWDHHKEQWVKLTF